MAIVFVRVFGSSNGNNNKNPTHSLPRKFKVHQILPPPKFAATKIGMRFFDVSYETLMSYFFYLRTEKKMSDTTLSFLTTEIGILNASALVFSKRILLSDINKNGTYVKIEIECHKDSKIRHLFVLIQLLKCRFNSRQKSCGCQQYLGVGTSRVGTRKM